VTVLKLRTTFKDFRTMRFPTRADHLCEECNNLIPSGTLTCLHREKGTGGSRRAYICIGCVWKALDAETEAEAIPMQYLKEHDWQFYANGSFCRRCGTHIGSGQSCR